jgi:hypothetical protein
MLPRELRGIVYSCLVPKQITLCQIPFDYYLNNLHVHEHYDGHVDIGAQKSVYSIFRPYTNLSQRTQEDRFVHNTIGATTSLDSNMLAS